MTREELLQLLKDHRSVKGICLATGLSSTLIYKYLKQYQITVFSKKINKEKLSELYQNLSTRQIATQLGCTHQSVVNWINEYQIEKKQQGRPDQLLKYDLDKESLSNYMKEFRSIRQISIHTNIPVRVVKKLMDRYDIQKMKIDKDYLENEYINNKKSINQIALECKVLNKTIYFYMKKFKINL